MEVKDKKRGKWSAITLVCVAAIIMSVTTVVSFAATGQGDAPSKSAIPGGKGVVKEYESAVFTGTGQNAGIRVKYVGAKTNVSYDGGKTWKTIADKTRTIKYVGAKTMVSDNDGKTWKTIADKTQTFKYVDGKIKVSYDGGETWEKVSDPVRTIKVSTTK
jgi:hypothetical protein